MAHPAVAEAAVIAMAHSKWGERPLAVVVARSGQSVSSDQLREFLGSQVAKWWIPDSFELVDEIPRTVAGKFDKVALRRKFADRNV